MRVIPQSECFRCYLCKHSILYCFGRRPTQEPRRGTPDTPGQFQTECFRCYLCKHSILYCFGRRPTQEPRRGTPDTPGQFQINADGTIYQAASLKELQAWAEAGRLHGAYLVSSDGKKWRSAHTIPELGFTWEATVEGSSRAFLLNPKAVLDLALSDAIPENATITDTKTGKTMPLSEAIDLQRDES